MEFVTVLWRDSGQKGTWGHLDLPSAQRRVSCQDHKWRSLKHSELQIPQGDFFSLYRISFLCCNLPPVFSLQTTEEMLSASSPQLYLSEWTDATNSLLSFLYSSLNTASSPTLSSYIISISMLAVSHWVLSCLLIFVLPCRSQNQTVYSRVIPLLL